VPRDDSLSTNIEVEMPVETSGPHNCIINCLRQALTPREYICDFKSALLDGNRTRTEIKLLVSLIFVLKIKSRLLVKRVL